MTCDQEQDRVLRRVFDAVEQAVQESAGPKQLGVGLGHSALTHDQDNGFCTLADPFVGDVAVDIVGDPDAGQVDQDDFTGQFVRIPVHFQLADQGREETRGVVTEIGMKAPIAAHAHSAIGLAALCQRQHGTDSQKPRLVFRAGRRAPDTGPAHRCPKTVGQVRQLLLAVLAAGHHQLGLLHVLDDLAPRGRLFVDDNLLDLFPDFNLDPFRGRRLRLGDSLLLAGLDAPLQCEDDLPELARAVIVGLKAGLVSAPDRQGLGRQGTDPTGGQDHFLSGDQRVDQGALADTGYTKEANREFTAERITDPAQTSQVGVELIQAAGLLPSEERPDAARVPALDGLGLLAYT
jgi:hypothetical protein